jgi:hypothetical protein
VLLQRRLLFNVLLWSGLLLSVTGCHARDPYFTVQLLGPIVPHGLREGYEVREFILDHSDELKSLPPGEAMNEIYRQALMETNGDKGAAYLASMIAVFEHRNIPISGLGITLPLTLENDSVFHQRHDDLPRNIYGEGQDDRDKLQHFFANAWLKKELGMEWLVRLIGEFVELGEDAVVEGGVYDERDKRANSDGIRFGANSADSLEAVPSNYIRRKN